MYIENVPVGSTVKTPHVTVEVLSTVTRVGRFVRADVRDLRTGLRSKALFRLGTPVALLAE